MLDKEEFALPLDKKASLVSIVCEKLENHKNEKQTSLSLRELRELLRTLGIETGESYIQNKKQLEAGTMLGTGKLKEIAREAIEEGSKILVFDFELSGSQMKNIKKITGMEVVDRCNIILEIFARHARTKEAKIQIEISRLQYLLPRLSNFWSHLGRQKGGIGVRGGEGEQQIELDRRIIGDKISHYKKQLKSIETSREQQRKKRQNQAVTAALVGYTNAGKSSVMNRLCQVSILEENKLFATLDSTFRMLNPDTQPPMLLIDTVGFISNLPNTLVEGFKTTLESAVEADLLVMVVDLSDENFENHIKVTEEVLGELGITDKPILYVFNKKDQVDSILNKQILLRKYPNKFIVSSFDKEDMDELREYIINHFLEQQEKIDLFIPYEDGQAHSLVNGKTNVLKTHNHETGIYYKVRVPDFIFQSLDLKNYVLQPNDPRINP